MPQESAKAVISTFTGAGLVRVINDSAGTPTSRNMSPEDLLAEMGGGTGGGAVDSVNGAVGVVVLDADDISDTGTTNQFATAAELTKLSGIATGAEVNVQSDWNAASGDAFILNKPPRVSTTTSTATPTINTDTVDHYILTALAVNITSFTTNLTGTPIAGQRLRISVMGTSTRTIAWGASFESGQLVLPTSTDITERLDVGFVWNTNTSKWRLVEAPSPVVKCIWTGSAWTALGGGVVPIAPWRVREYSSVNDPSAPAPVAYNAHDSWDGLDT